MSAYNKQVGRLTGKCLTIGGNKPVDMTEWGICSGSRTIALFTMAAAKAVRLALVSDKELDVNMEGMTITVHARRRILLEEFISSFVPGAKPFTVTHVGFNYLGATVLNATKINIFQLMADMYLLDNYAPSGWHKRPERVRNRLILAAATVWYLSGVKPGQQYDEHEAAIRHEYAYMRSLRSLEL